MAMLDKGMVHVPGGVKGTVQDFFMLLGMACDLKLINCSGIFQVIFSDVTKTGESATLDKGDYTTVYIKKERSAG